MSREMAKISFSGAIRAGMERIWRIERRCTGCYAWAPGTGSGTVRAPLDQGGRPEGEDVVVLDHDFEASGMVPIERVTGRCSTPHLNNTFSLWNACMVMKSAEDCV
jgi:hypothetical protein